MPGLLKIIQRTDGCISLLFHHGKIEALNILFQRLLAAASPELANQIGQYFKGKMVNGELSTGDNIAHKLAHGILGAAVAAATASGRCAGLGKR